MSFFGCFEEAVEELFIVSVQSPHPRQRTSSDQFITNTPPPPPIATEGLGHVIDSFLP